MSQLHRRVFVVRSLTIVATSPVVGLLGCGGDDAADGDGGGTGTTSGGSSGEASAADETTNAGSTTGAPAESSGGPEGTTSGGGSSTDGGGSEGSSSGGEDSGSSDTGASACEPSPSDIEGPFYRPGIPVGGNLDVHGDDGVPLLLSGHVVDEACAPLAGAVVEIWHATPLAPDGMPGDVNATYDDTAEYRYYGQVATDEEGAFSFVTLRPGWYLNGESYRPAHVHVKVWIGGVERLTSQLYFEGDPFNASDPWFNPLMSLDPDDAGAVEVELVV
ncbi:MAG: hypothetical protein AAF721_09890 [Myxococcota bacterium]